MRKFALICLVLAGLFSGCRSGDDPKPPEGKFGGKESSRSSGETSKGYFAREQEKKRRYEREFRDVRRPMNQDHFKVTPWSGKHYTPRSERLHDSSREENNSIFKF